MESWLCTRLGLSYATAQEYVRVARALADLPSCAQALAGGRFSWDQVRALSRFARPEEDEALAAQASGKSAAALEWAARRVSREEAQDEHDRRGLRWWMPHDGGFRLSARLPAADGAVVAAAAEWLSDRLPAERTTTVCSSRRRSATPTPWSRSPPAGWQRTLTPTGPAWSSTWTPARWPAETAAPSF